MKSYFYFGNYQDKQANKEDQSEGISFWSVDHQSGALKKEIKDISVIENTHFSITDKHLYAANDIFSFQDKTDGCLTVYQRSDDNQLSAIQRVSSGGVGTVYTRLVADNRFLLIANYIEGNILVYPVGYDHLLADPVENIKHIGSSANTARQEAAHPHAIEMTVDEKFVYVADLGMDKLKAYQFDQKSGRLKSNTKFDIATHPGSGPRHLRFHDNGKFAYVSHEMSNQVSAYTCEGDALTLIAYYDLANGSDGIESTGSELHIHPSGRYIYASSRGDNTLVVFSIDANSGALSKIQTLSTEGETPTSFDIDKSGQYLVLGNQLSHSLLSFSIDNQSGRLTVKYKVEQVSQPIMIGFI